MMRLIGLFSIIIIAICLGNCHGLHEGYLDLSTGQKIEVVTQAETGKIINKNTGDPLYIVVDLIEDDTIYGKTGEVINGHVINRGNKYIYDKDEEEILKISDSGAVKYKDESEKFKDGDHKTKVKKNGDIKIKNGDRKVKIDGATGKETIK